MCVSIFPSFPLYHLHFSDFDLSQVGQLISSLLSLVFHLYYSIPLSLSLFSINLSLSLLPFTPGSLSLSLSLLSTVIVNEVCSRCFFNSSHFRNSFPLREEETLLFDSQSPVTNAGDPTRDLLKLSFHLISLLKSSNSPFRIQVTGRLSCPDSSTNKRR